LCGRFNLIDSPEVQWLCESLGIGVTAVKTSADIAPGGRISIIHEKQGERRISEAIWWLFLDRDSLKPDYKYTSFNSRSDKLHQQKSISFKPYRESRCIIPASAFAEGLGDKQTYHKIELEDSAIAFGGLYQEYISKDTGESVYATSIITLPPLIPEWAKIHPKSTPLMLPFEDDELMGKWLDPAFNQVEEFDQLLTTRLSKSMRVTQIDRPSKWNPIADSYVIL
jgi:putative SOS response-associated peptidase YedK|tara:strand:- start:1546 stop:2220 length:675 start_codon:yes stop_codon:yes gene_type:complete